MATDKEVQDAVAALAQETSNEDDLTKSLVGIIDRLTKGDSFAAMGKNKDDKSSQNDVAGGTEGFASIEAEEKPEGAEARVARSSKVKTAVPSDPTAILEKGKDDEDDEDENKDDDDKDDDDKDKPFFAKEKGDAKDDESEGEFKMSKKSRAAIDENTIFKALTTGELSDEYVPVAEASDVIQYMTDTFAKAFAHISEQIAAFSEELHERLDVVEKSQALQRDAAAVLAKSAQAQLARTAPMTKSAATPSSGIAIVNVGEDKQPSGTGPEKGTLVKSILAAMNSGDLNPQLGTSIMARLDSQNPAAVWDTIPTTVRDIIAKSAPQK